MAIVAFPSTFAICKDTAGTENVVKDIFFKNHGQFRMRLQWACVFFFNVSLIIKNWHETTPYK